MGRCERLEVKVEFDSMVVWYLREESFKKEGDKKIRFFGKGVRGIECWKGNIGYIFFF